MLVFLLVPVVSFAASTLFPQSGGTGTASIPTLGQVLVGQSNGTYQPQATSTLGISGGTGSSFAYLFPANATSTLLTFSGGATVGGTFTLSALTGTQCLHEVSGVVSGTGTDCGSSGGSVTSVSGTYPILSSGSTAITISTAFGTTTSNTFAGTQTFTNSPVFSTLGAGTVNSTSGGSVYNTATSSLSISSPLTGSGFGALIGGTNSTIGCQAASGSQAGCLSAADWTTFNNKTSNTGTVTSIVAGTGLSGGTITTTGTIAVNTTQNITTLSNLTVAGLVQTTSGGVLSSALLTSGQVTTALGFTPGTGTVNSGTTGQDAFYASSGVAVSATSTIFIAPSSFVGIGTTTPLNDVQITGTAGAGKVTGLGINDPTFSQSNILIGSFKDPGLGFVEPAIWMGASALAPSETNYIFNLDDGGAGGTVLNAPNSNNLSLRMNNVSKLTILGTNNNVGIASTTPGSFFALGTTNGINFTSATTTFSSTGGINLAAGCYAIAGTCIGSGGGGSGTVGAGTTGQFPYYAANGTTLTATSSIFLATTGNVGIGTTNPTANLFIQDQPGAPQSQAILSIASSTPGVNAFSVYPDGYIQAGPLVSKDTAFCTFGKLCLGYFGSDNTLSGTNIEEGNYSNGGSAYGGFTALNNLDDATGAHYAFFGLTSSNYNDPTFGTSQAFPNQMQLVNSDGQIVIQANFNATTTVPSANNIIFDVNGNSTAAEVGRFTTTGLGIGSSTPGSLLSLGNTNGINFSTATSTFNSTGGINIASGCYSIAGTCIGGSGGAVSSVSNSDGSLTISPTTGSVVASVNLAHSNAFTSSQSVQSTSATAFTVGANGATNPALTIDGSTASSVTGIAIKSAATGGQTTITATDSGANSQLAISSKGNGQFTLTAPSGSMVLNQGGTSVLQISGGDFLFQQGANTSGPHYTFTGVADTALAAGANAPWFKLNGAQTRTHATGAVAEQDDIFTTCPTDTFASGAAAASVITTDSCETLGGMPLIGARGSATNRVGLYFNPGNFSDNPGNNPVASSTNDYGMYITGPLYSYNGGNSLRTGPAVSFDYEGGTPGAPGNFEQANGNINLANFGTSTPTQAEVTIQNIPASSVFTTAGAAGYNPLASIFRIASTTNSTETADVTTFTALNNGNVGVGTSTPTAAFVSVAASTTIGTTETAYTGQVSIIAGLENGVTKLFQDIDQWGHLITSGDAPTVTGGTSSVSGNDRNGTVTVTGTALTSVTLNFAHPWLSTPECTVATNSTASVADISSISTTAVTFGFSVGLSSNSLYYICASHQ